jgi:predicted dehydrogenase
MLRMAVVGADAADWNIVAARVRHACLERCEKASPADPAWSSADAVAFVGTAKLDRDLAARVLAGGKHLLLATNAALAIPDLERWAELARSHRVRLEIVNPERARPSRRLIRQQIADGKLGDVGLVRISRSTPVSSGGAIVGDLDLATWLIGRMPNTVYAIRRVVQMEAAPNAECLHVHLGFPQGGMALLTQTTAVAAGDAYEALSVIAFSGAAYADDHQNRQLLLSGGAATALPVDDGDALAVLLDEFASRVQGSVEPTDSLDSWRRLVAIADAVERSAASQQAVSLELD